MSLGRDEQAATIRDAAAIVEAGPDAHISPLTAWRLAQAIVALAAALADHEGPTLELLPAENMALTVALAQVLRGEDPAPNTATVCVLALARVMGRHDWREDAR